MKKLILLSLLLSLLADLSWSQDSIPVIFNVRDDAALGNPDWGDGVIEFNGNILVMGNAYFGNRYGITVTCYDTTGAKLWSKINTDIRFPEFQGNRIMALNDHSFFIGGVKEESYAVPYTSFLAKFDEYGDTLFLRTYPDTIENFLCDIAKYSEDTLMMLSVRNEDSWGEYHQTQITLLDTNGNVLHSSSYEPDLSPPRQILRFQDKIYAGGTCKTDTGWYYNVKVFIKRYDMDLNYLGWSSPSLTINEYFKNLCFMGDQLYLTSSITTFYPPDPRNHYRPYISLITPEGTPLISTFFGPAYIADPIGGKTVNVGDSILACWVDLDTSKIYFFDRYLDPLCEYIIDRHGGPFDPAWISDMTFIPPDKLAGTGMIALTDSIPVIIQDPWNFLTGDVLTHVFNKCIYVEVNEASAQSKKQFDVFPTLATDRITLRSRDPESARIYARLYDMNGRLSMEESFFSETQLDLGALKNGFYILRISSSSHLETFKIVISR